jgi:hypothetical protein
MRGGGWETLGVAPVGRTRGRRLAGDLPAAGRRRPRVCAKSIVARPRAAVRRIEPWNRRQVPMRIVPRRVPRPVSADRSAHAPDLCGARISFASRSAVAVEDTRAGVWFRESGVVEVFGLCIGIFHQSTVPSGGAGSGGRTSRIANFAPQSRHKAEPIALIQEPDRGKRRIRTLELPHRGQ